MDELMTNEGEDKAIHDILARKAQNAIIPHSLREIFNALQIRHAYYDIIRDRLVQEDLVTISGQNRLEFIRLSPKGVRIAREPEGYLGTLQKERLRSEKEESRANLNVVGTFGSMVIAGLALLFSLYTYFSTASDVKKLEETVEAQNARLKKLENPHTAQQR